MSCFVSQYNAFSASDLKYALVFIGKICMYVVRTVERDLDRAAYGGFYLPIENSPCVAMLCLLPKKPNKTKPSITVKQLCFSCLFFWSSART